MTKKIQAVTRAVSALLLCGVKRATVYVSKDLVVAATRNSRVYKGSYAKTESVTLKIGKPNYKERRFIALCRKAKEPLPVKKVQLKYYR